MRHLLPVWFGLLLVVPTMALAQLDITNPQLIPETGVLSPTCNFVTGDLHYECIPIYLAYVIKLIFGFTGMICLLQIMRAGYELAFSGFGDRESSKKRIQNALLGLAVCIFSYLIVDTVVTVLLSGPVT